MEINQLKYFKAVADSGKITSAAKELFLSPPAISASIAAVMRSSGVLMQSVTIAMVLSIPTLFISLIAL